MGRAQLFIASERADDSLAYLDCIEIQLGLLFELILKVHDLRSLLDQFFT